ncbi:MAG TPA: VOC family protein [Dehalococcoidia bacterium]|nr:VOC family protein [Dehalococcoidia bacterium]
MANPVVHFEIIGKDAAKTQQYYADLFGWKVDANNPMSYGIVDTGGQGINGGIAGTQNGDQPRTLFYVAVPDLQATLDRAVSLGGKVLMPVTEIPNTVTLAMFSDPDGNTIGLLKDSM